MNELANQRPPLTRLTRVELRKMVDTRSGFWLQLTVLALTVLVVVITLIAGHESDFTFRNLFGNALVPAGILLPVVGILLVSSEWSQRTALVSFALVPERARLIAAKVLAGVVLGLVAVVVAAVLAAIGTAVASPDVSHVWTFPVVLIGQYALYRPVRPIYMW
jgi:ABC-2 type transport system permease protein